jgi:HK97 gp10 family phage protein
MPKVKVTMKLEGVEALQRAITAAPEAVARMTADVMAKTAFAIAQRAKVLVPVRTGTLQRAIVSSATARSGRVGLEAGSPAKRYWHMVEHGTVKMSAHPYFRPAADAEEPMFIRRIQDISTTLERGFASGRYL